MLNIKQLDHFVLTVNDLNKSQNFYHSVLGLKIIEATDDHVSLQCGSQLLRLRKLTNEVNSIVASKLVTGAFDFCIQATNSIDQIIDYLNQQNQNIVLGPVTRFGSNGKMTSIYVRDPDDNLIEICTYDE